MKQYQAVWKAEGTIPGWGLLNLAPESLTYYELLIRTLARYFFVGYGTVISHSDQSQRADKKLNRSKLKEMPRSHRLP